MPNDTQIAKVELADRDVEIKPFGSDELIKLNVKIVQNMIAVPTKSGHRPDATQAIKFMMLCKARHLNPFEGDAFLIGYDTHTGPQFSLITAHQVFLKRAEASKDFDGMESGVILLSEDESHTEEREGDFTMDGEKVVGGWAKVYRKDRGKPMYRRLKLSTFKKGYGRWNDDAAGMIVKCAEADALRSAFPTHLGGLYLREESEPLDVTATVVPNGTASPDIKFGPALPGPQPEPPTEPTPPPNGEVHKAPEKKTRKRQETPPEQPKDTPEQKQATPPPQDPGPFNAGGEPPDATPLDVLRAKFTAKGIEETKFQRFLIMEGYIEPSDKLDRLPNAKTQEIVDSFDSVLPAFLETQPK